VNIKIEDYKSLILSPYYDRINKAIKAVAQRLKLKQVIDIQSVALAYLDPTSDITEEVIKEMKN
jgi:Skp family chaperone for outer membrane proteins